MDNYFILLGLSFDPIENDENKINEAINKKMQQWQNESKNPRKAILAKENMAMVPEIKKVMLDAELRKNEAKKALKEQSKVLKDVYYDVLIKSTKGTITTEEINEIYKKYKDYNISIEQIKNQIEVPIDGEIDSGNNDEENIDIINDDIRSQLETYFHNLSIDDMSLYIFINGKEKDSNETLKNLAEKKLQFILQKGDKSTQDEVEQKIAGLAKNIFSSDEERKKYDNYLSGSRYYKLNELLRAGIKSNNNIINANLYNIIVNIANKEYSLSKEESINYINNFAKIYKVDLDKKIITDFILNQTQNIDLDKNDNKEQYNTNEEPEEIEDDFEEIIDTPEPIQPQPQPVPIPKPVPPPQPTFNVNDIISPLQNRLNVLNNNNINYVKEVEFYDSEYKRVSRLPNKLSLIIYIIILSIFLLANISISIAYFVTSDEKIKLFLAVSSIACIVEIGYSVILFKNLKTYNDYKNLTFLSKNKFDTLINEKFVNSTLSLLEIQNNPSKAIEYFEDLRQESETLHNLTYNMKIKCLNALSKFNKAPKKVIYFQ